MGRKLQVIRGGLRDVCRALFANTDVKVIGDRGIFTMGDIVNI